MSATTKSETTAKPIKLTWAQRNKTVLLTCNVMDAVDVEVIVADVALGQGGDSESTTSSAAKKDAPLTNSKIIICMKGPSTDAVIQPAGTPSTSVPLVQYEEVLDLYQLIDPQSVMVHLTGRNVYIRLTKQFIGGSAEKSFWPRLLKDAAEQKRKKNITVDWGLWKDEDDIAEEAEEEEFANIGSFKAFTMSNGVNVNGGGDPDVVARMLNPETV